MSFVNRILKFFENFFTFLRDGNNPSKPKPVEPAPRPEEIFQPPPKPTPEEEEEIAADGSDIIAENETIGTLVVPEELDIVKPDEVTSDITVDIPDTLDPSPVITTPTDENDEEAPQPKGKYLWCLDNGHGMFTKGKRSPKFEDGTRFYEYEFNRDIVKRIIKKLDELGIQYYNVVPEIEIDNFLSGRVGRANAYQSDLPKLYISIHANAARSQSIDHWASPAAKGAETWYYKGSARGRKLASVFQKHIVAYTGMVNRGLKATTGLYVIRNTNMTAVLTENGFYNHPAETKSLMKDEVRQSIADAHIAAIVEIEKNGL